MNFWFWFWLFICYGSIVFAFILIMRVATKTRKEQEAKAWKALNPDSKQSKIAPLRIGRTYETFQNGSATRFDPPIPFDKPFNLQGD